MRNYQRKIGSNPKWSPIELGVAIALHDLDYDLSTIRRRWLRWRSEDAIWNQIRQFYPKQRVDPSKIDWNPQLVDHLTMLWLIGVSSAKISRRLSISRNSVIGKLYGINLIPQQAIDYGKNPYIQSAQKAYPEAKLIRGRT